MLPAPLNRPADRYAGSRRSSGVAGTTAGSFALNQLQKQLLPSCTMSADGGGVGHHTVSSSAGGTILTCTNSNGVVSTTTTAAAAAAAAAMQRPPPPLSVCTPAPVSASNSTPSPLPVGQTASASGAQGIVPHTPTHTHFTQKPMIFRFRFVFVSVFFMQTKICSLYKGK